MERFIPPIIDSQKDNSMLDMLFSSFCFYFSVLDYSSRFCDLLFAQSNQNLRWVENSRSEGLPSEATVQDGRAGAGWVETNPAFTVHEPR